MKPLLQTSIRTALIVLLMLAGSSLVANAQDPRIQMNSLDHLAAKAKETVDVNLDERLMRLASKIFTDDDPEDQDIKKFVAALKGVYVKSFEFESPGQFTDADVEPIRAQLRAPGWTRLVNIKSKKEGSLEVHVLMTGDQINGLTVLATEDNELTVVNIVGPVDLNKLARLEGKFGIPDLGLEQQKPKTKNDEK